MTRHQKLVFAGMGSLAVLASLWAGTLIGRSQAQSAGEPATVQYEGREIPNSIEEILSPKHTVLVVHETLNDWIKPNGYYDKLGRRYDPGRMATIVPPIQKLIAAARAKGVPVAFVRWTSHADRSTDSDPDRRRSLTRPGAADRIPPSGVDGTWGWENIEELTPAPGDWIVRKYRPDSFFASPLDALLRWHGTKTIVMVGIGGEVGVLPTLTTAANIGYFRVAVGDGILSSNASRMEETMKAIAQRAIVKSHSEIIDIWNRSPALTTNAPKPTEAGNGDAARAGAEPATITYKGREIAYSMDEILHPRHTVLVVHELLNTFISEGGAYDRRGRKYDPKRMARILPPTRKLLAMAREKKVQVAYLRYTTHRDGSHAAEPQIRSWFLNSGGPPEGDIDYGTVDGTWGWQNIDEVKPQPGDWIIRKHRRNGFIQTPLDTLLRWNGTKTVILLGIGGEVGLLPTTATAAELGYFTIVPEDCILSSNASRQDAMMPFFRDYAMLKKSSELIESWSRR